MKKILLLAVFALIQLSACEWLRGVEGSGVIVEEKRAIQGVQALRISGGYELTVTVGPEESLILKGDDNLLPLITTVVEDGVLTVKNKKAISPKSPIRLTVTVKALKSLKVSGSARGTVTGLQTPEFELACSGSCGLTLSGKADVLGIDVSGSGKVDATALPVATARVKISGSGETDLTVSESLSVKISGSGTVRYVGNPKLERSVSGSGEILQRQPASGTETLRP